MARKVNHRWGKGFGMRALEGRAGLGDMGIEEHHQIKKRASNLYLLGGFGLLRRVRRLSRSSTTLGVSSWKVFIYNSRASAFAFPLGLPDILVVGKTGKGGKKGGKAKGDKCSFEPRIYRQSSYIGQRVLSWLTGSFF
ncbi:hypothetical protein IF1G_00556 [Cordyceps javanica]|uniref:Uncharacterized protein n=1 Tax=Cordyceps javanica TaxID=43265 RepID=A0A545VFX1_9HYPO|nr:hypothetical protein IF1G_00556 [Cordyceps javanica]